MKPELSIIASDTDFIENFEILMGRLILISGLPEDGETVLPEELSEIIEKIETENELIIAKTIKQISITLNCNLHHAEDCMNELSDHLYHVHDSESYFVSKAGMMQIALEAGCQLKG